jgi:hypothetical protein
MNELSVTERETIIGLLRLRWTQRRIERETGHRRETIARIGREAGLLVAKPAKVPTDLDANSAPATVSRSSCEPYREIIEANLVKGCNGKVIYQGLVEHHGYEGGYDAAKRFIRKLRPADPKISCRFETAPGGAALADPRDQPPAFRGKRGTILVALKKGKAPVNVIFHKGFGALHRQGLEPRTN